MNLYPLPATAIPPVRTAHYLLPLLLASSLLAGCSSDDDDDDDARASVIAWQDCADNATLDCATLDVPLIHDSTDERTVTIDLIRWPASGSGDVQSLLMNPGGPGGSGTDLVRNLADEESVPDAVRERFDLVGFDPRGTGVSFQVDCREFGIDELNDYPVDREEVDALLVQSRRVADACFERYGDTLQWLGSHSVVQDMEQIRQALGEPALNFLGYSYGSRLAALYLQRYPISSGRIILDGSLLPDGLLRPLVAGQALGLQRNIDAVFSICGTTVPECVPEELEAALAARVEDIRVRNDEEAFELFGELLAVTAQEPDIGEFTAGPLLDYIRTGELQGLRNLVQFLEGLGLEADDDDEGSVSTVQRAVLCADDPTRPDNAAIDTLRAELDTVSDTFGEALTALGATCVGWPEALDPVASIAVDTAPVSLIIGGSSDAQTLVEWGPLMATAIGARYLLSDHAGHTVVFQDTSDCADEAATAFLLEGTLPAGERC